MLCDWVVQGIESVKRETSVLMSFNFEPLRLEVNRLKKSASTPPCTPPTTFSTHPSHQPGLDHGNNDNDIAAHSKQSPT